MYLLIMQRPLRSRATSIPNQNAQDQRDDIDVAPSADARHISFDDSCKKDDGDEVRLLKKANAQFFNSKLNL